MKKLAFRFIISTILMFTLTTMVSSCGSADDNLVLTNVFRTTLAESYETESSVSIVYMRCYNGKVFTAYQNGWNVTVRSISDDGVSEESTYKVPRFSENSEVYLQNFDLRDGKPVLLLSIPDENALRLNYYVLECGGDNEEGILLPEFNQTAELFAAGSEYIILASTDNISVFSYDGVLVSECDIDGELTAMTENNLAYRNGNKYYISSFDAENGTISDTVEVKLDGVRNIYFDENGNYYADTKDSLYIAEGNEYKEVISWKNSAIDHSLISQLFVIDSDNAAYYRRNTVINKDQIIYLTRVPDDAVAEKTMLTLGVTQNTGVLNDAVLEFNQNNGIYHIEIIDYSPKKSDPQASERLGLDIAAGNIPDIIQITENIDYNSFYRKNLFEDLLPYIDNDTTISRDDFLDGVVDGAKQDGKLCILPYTIVINTVVTKEKLVDGPDGWTIDDFLDFADSHASALMTFNNRLEDFDALCAANRSTICEEYGKSGGLLEKILEYSKKISEEYPISYMDDDELQEYDSDRYRMYRDENVLTWTSPIRTFNDYTTVKGAFGDEPISFIGYPTESGGKIFIVPQLALAMSSKSDNKDGVWEFLRMTFDDTFYQYDKTYGFPTTEAGFEKFVESARKYRFYFNPRGTAVASEYAYDEPGSYEIPLEDSDIQIIRELISGAEMYIADRKYISLINEDAAVYFEDKKSLEETLNVIGDRLETYINEQT